MHCTFDQFADAVLRANKDRPIGVFQDYRGIDCALCRWIINSLRHVALLSLQTRRVAVHFAGLQAQSFPITRSTRKEMQSFAVRPLCCFQVYRTSPAELPRQHWTAFQCSTFVGALCLLSSCKAEKPIFVEGI